jgi:hypothetical protein
MICGPDVTGTCPIGCRVNTPRQHIGATFTRNASLMLKINEHSTDVVEYNVLILVKAADAGMLEACSNNVIFIKINVASTCNSTGQLIDWCSSAWDSHLPHTPMSSWPPVCSYSTTPSVTHCIRVAFAKGHAGVPHLALQPGPATRRAAPACDIQ